MSLSNKHYELVARQCGMPLDEVSKIPAHLQKTKVIATLISAYRKSIEKLAEEKYTQ
jgi:hypothetical protein